MIISLSSLVKTLSSFSPPGLILSVAAAFLVERKYLHTWINEFLGTMLMIGCTFSAGKWIGEDDWVVAWVSHALGVITADYFGGGPHVNPAVSMSMWALGKVNYTEMFVRVSAQMGGGLISFPFYKIFASTLQLTELGGPAYDPTEDAHGAKAFASEFCAVIVLLFGIYAFNWELHFGTYHYIIKQTLTALTIRYCIEVFPASGPAINPMLGTSWAVFASDSSEFPSDPEHYFVYWLAPYLGAIVASFGYVVYAGGKFFGRDVPFGPIKEVEVVEQKKD